MKYATRIWFRKFIFRLGTLLSAHTINRLDNLLNHLATGSWVKSRGCTGIPEYSSREELFTRIAADVRNDRVLYLEFGVYRGDSMREFSRLLTNLGSSLHGFDSFEGLPQDWKPDAQRGHFSTAGALPQIDDQRVQFFKGWFSDTLPVHQFPPFDRLIVNLDADLYSSTKFVLDELAERIVVGTCLYFDEFHVRNHELQAFREFEAETGMKFEVIGQSACWEHVALRRVS